MNQSCPLDHLQPVDQVRVPWNIRYLATAGTKHLECRLLQATIQVERRHRRDQRVVLRRPARRADEGGLEQRPFFASTESTAPVNYTNLAYVARETWTFTSWTQ